MVNYLTELLFIGRKVKYINKKGLDEKLVHSGPARTRSGIKIKNQETSDCFAKSSNFSTTEKTYFELIVAIQKNINKKIVISKYFYSRIENKKWRNIQNFITTSMHKQFGKDMK